MLWALSDPGGLPAKRFAELDPVPSLDWLEPLSQDLYRHADLGRFSMLRMALLVQSMSLIHCHAQSHATAPHTTPQAMH